MKIKSIGTIITGIFSIILGLCGLLFHWLIVQTKADLGSITTIYIVGYFLFIVSGIGILFLRNWARRLYLILPIVFFVATWLLNIITWEGNIGIVKKITDSFFCTAELLVFFFPLSIPLIVTLIFLTRSKVATRFKI